MGTSYSSIKKLGPIVPKYIYGQQMRLLEEKKFRCFHPFETESLCFLAVGLLNSIWFYSRTAPVIHFTRLLGQTSPLPREKTSCKLVLSQEILWKVVFINSLKK